MATELTITAKTATSASMTVAGIPAGGTVQIQVSDNPRFTGMVTWANYAASPVTILGLNQRGSYWLRARGITAGGALEAFGATISIYTPSSALPDTSPAAIMVEPAVIFVPEPILAITNEGAVAGYPGSNMLRDDPVSVYAAVATNPAFDVQHAGAPIDTIVLMDTTASEAATISIRAGNTLAEAAAGTGYQLLDQPFRASPNLGQRRGYHAIVRLPAPQAFPFWRITLGTTVANGGNRQLFMARYFAMGLNRPTKNISADKGENPLDLGSIDRSRDGTADRIHGHRMRKVDFELSLLTETQWETGLGDLWQKIGLNEPVFVLPNSKAGAFRHDRMLFGTLASSRATNLVAPRFTHALSVESLT